VSLAFRQVTYFDRYRGYVLGGLLVDAPRS
jgi:hypothetical protein